MKFLESVAKSLLREKDYDLSDVVVVFPNRRSKLFFDKALKNQIQKPLFSPEYTDIGGLFEYATGMQKSDKILLNAILHKVYQKHFEAANGGAQTESFDEFFFFGETILSDFDDIDKYLINARELYRNMDDLSRLEDDFSHLSSEQSEFLKRFFRDFGGESKLQQEFSKIWAILYDVYQEFRATLKSKGLAYEGMIQRETVDNWGMYEEKFDKTYAFVGFNVLSKTEEELFRQLRSKSLFYWDSDDYYCRDSSANEAGHFIMQNMRDFPSPKSFSLEHSGFSKKKRVNIISAPTELSQLSYIPKFIEGIQDKSQLREPETAIVFNREHLLLPALDFLPATGGDVNITMGFPLTHTTIYDFTLRLIELRGNGFTEGKLYYQPLLSLLENPYSTLLLADTDLARRIEDEKIFYLDIDTDESPLFQGLATANPPEFVEYLQRLVGQIGASLPKPIRQRKGEEVSPENNQNILAIEAVFQVYTELGRLRDLLTTEEIQLNMTTLLMLIRRILSQKSITFHGEPAHGLQLMGILETRNMDFRNLLLLSMNEGVMPKVEPKGSFIPHFMRRAYGMSDITHQDSMFAYYFYRLLQRADNIHLIYSENSGQTSAAERSRFIMQLQTELKSYNEEVEINYFSLKSNILSGEVGEKVVEKNAEVMQKIEAIRRISPSAMNSYLDCPMKFYYSYVEGLSEEESLTDEMDNRILGTVVHRAIELIYKEILPKEQVRWRESEIAKERIDFAKNFIPKKLQKAFAEEYFGGKDRSYNDYNGEQKIYFSVARKFIEKLLDFDKMQTPFRIIGLEQWVELEFLGNIKLGGIIDRLRLKSGTLYIDDFKTSKQPTIKTNIANIFERKTYDKSKSYNLQTLYYSLVISRLQRLTIYGEDESGKRTEVGTLLDKSELQRLKISPTLLYLPSLLRDEFKPEVYGIKDFASESIIVEEGKESLPEWLDSQLTATIAEILDPEKPFTQKADPRNCEYCDFRKLCSK